MNLDTLRRSMERDALHVSPTIGLALLDVADAAYELLYGEPDIVLDGLSRDRHRANVRRALARLDRLVAPHTEEN